MNLIYVGTATALNAEMQRMFEFASAKWGDVGYTVYDEIHTAPDGTKYIASPAAAPRFDGYVPTENVVEMEFPSAWETEEA